MDKAVAVITRTKNRPRMLARAMDSVLGQSLADWVHVVVNDGGDAAAVDALAAERASAYDGRLLVLHHPASLGMEAASNAGIAASRSRWLAIHDDDDSWDPGFLAAATAFLSEQGGRYAGVVTHSWKIIEDGETLAEQGREMVTPIDNVTAATLLATNLFPPIAFVYERAALEAIGPYDAALPVLGDWEFNIRFIRRFDIGVIPRPLANWHHRPAATGAAGNSIFAGAGTHAAYRALLRNRWLREDAEAGHAGFGALAAIGAQTEALLLMQSDLVRREMAREVESRDARIRDLHQELERHIAEIHTLQAELAGRDGRIAGLHHQLEERIAEVLRGQAEAAALRAVADRTHAELEQCCAALEQCRAQAEEQRRTYEALLAELQARHDTLLASTSWRITAPLRSALRLLRGSAP